MIYLGNCRNQDIVAQEWYKEVEAFLTMRKKKNSRYRLHEKQRKKIVNTRFYNTYFHKMLGAGLLRLESKRKTMETERKLFGEILYYYKDHLKEIITANESNLVAVNQNYEDFYKGVDAKVRKWVENVVKSVLVGLYEDFTKTGSHVRDMLDRMHIRTCPYCNRSYIIAIYATAKGEVTVRPELDHFYPKSVHPFLVLSFYNLLPTCSACNHVKGNRIIGINPHFKKIESKFVVDDGKRNHDEMSKQDLLNLKRAEMNIHIEGTPEEQQNIEKFGINQLYKEHSDYVEEIFTKARAYDAYARKALAESFQKQGQTEQDVYDFVWGRYLDVAEQEKRPLSKLTRDLLDELGI